MRIFKKIILILIISVLLIGCNKKEENKKIEIDKTSFYGNWHPFYDSIESVDYVAFSLNEEDYEEKWIFNQDDNTITIKNYSIGSNYKVIENGEYIRLQRKLTEFGSDEEITYLSEKEYKERYTKVDITEENFFEYFEEQEVKEEWSKEDNIEGILTLNNIYRLKKEYQNSIYSIENKNYTFDQKISDIDIDFNNKKYNKTKEISNKKDVKGYMKGFYKDEIGIYILLDSKTNTEYIKSGSNYIKNINNKYYEYNNIKINNCNIKIGYLK